MGVFLIETPPQVSQEPGNSLTLSTLDLLALTQTEVCHDRFCQFKTHPLFHFIFMYFPLLTHPKGPHSLFYCRQVDDISAIFWQLPMSH